MTGFWRLKMMKVPEFSRLKMIGFFGFEDNWILTRENDENA
jgi:hypothetical protein